MNHVNVRPSFRQQQEQEEVPQFPWRDPHPHRRGEQRLPEEGAGEAAEGERKRDLHILQAEEGGRARLQVSLIDTVKASLSSIQSTTKF